MILRTKHVRTIILCNNKLGIFVKTWGPKRADIRSLKTVSAYGHIWTFIRGTNISRSNFVITMYEFQVKTNVANTKEFAKLN